ncbi:MAG: PIN domain-containing protein [Candidatus Heimdallarchaeota archaeon]
MKTLETKVLIDADVLIAYLADNALADHSAILIEKANTDQITLIGSPELYMDIITAYKSQGTTNSQIIRILGDLAAIKHKCMNSTLGISISALKYYSLYGGPRKLHFFDAFHVATARKYAFPLVTSDKFILQYANRMNIEVINLESIG